MNYWILLYEYVQYDVIDVCLRKMAKIRVLMKAELRGIETLLMIISIIFAGADLLCQN